MNAIKFYWRESFARTEYEHFLVKKWRAFFASYIQNNVRLPISLPMFYMSVLGRFKELFSSLISRQINS